MPAVLKALGSRTIDQADVKLTYASLMHDMTLSENQYANKKRYDQYAKTPKQSEEEYLLKKDSVPFFCQICRRHLTPKALECYFPAFLPQTVL